MAPGRSHMLIFSKVFFILFGIPVRFVFLRMKNS